MKQCILTDIQKIEIREVYVPDPAEGEIVIKVNTALTCGTDLKAYLRGHKLIPMPGPFGHEYAGTIAKTGKGVRKFREGDNVMGVHSAPCTKCGYCKKGQYNLCEDIMDTKALGAFAEYMLLPEEVVMQNLYIKPDSVIFQYAALLEPLSCVVHPYSKSMFDQTETALIIGAGPIGLLHLAFLRHHNITVIVNDISDDRLAIAKQMGADVISGTDNISSYISDKTAGMGVDSVIECTGQPAVWEQSVNYVRRGGTVIFFGGCPVGTKVQFDTHRLHYDELRVTGSFHYTPEDVKSACNLIIDKSLDLSHLISGEFRLNDIVKAFELLREGKGIKYAIKP